LGQYRAPGLTTSPMIFDDPTGLPSDREISGGLYTTFFPFVCQYVRSHDDLHERSMTLLSSIWLCCIGVGVCTGIGRRLNTIGCSFHEGQLLVHVHIKETETFRSFFPSFKGSLKDSDGPGLSPFLYIKELEANNATEFEVNRSISN